MHGSKLAAVLLVALGLTGAGVAAAAVGHGDADGSSEPVTTVVPEESTTTVAPTAPSAPRTTTVPVPNTDAVLGTDRSTEGCGSETFDNHGHYVSSVARNADRQPGDVPAAAQSSCGKPVASTTNDETGNETEQSEPDSLDGPASPAQPVHGPAAGHGNADGHA